MNGIKMTWEISIHLADLKNQLTYLQNQHYTPEIVKQEKEKQQELQLLLDMEESF